MSDITKSQNKPQTSLLELFAILFASYIVFVSIASFFVIIMVARSASGITPGAPSISAQEESLWWLFLRIVQILQFIIYSFFVSYKVAVFARYEKFIVKALTQIISLVPIFFIVGVTRPKDINDVIVGIPLFILGAILIIILTNYWFSKKQSKSQS